MDQDAEMMKLRIAVLRQNTVNICLIDALVTLWSESNLTESDRITQAMDRLIDAQRVFIEALQT